VAASNDHSNKTSMGRHHAAPLPCDFVMLALTLALVGCSSSGPGSPSDPAAECRARAPAKLSVSEGGRLTFARDGDLTYEATGGAVVTVDATTVTIRAPYLSAADGEVALRLGCGQTVPIALRPLAWTSVAKWGDDVGPPGREYGAWWTDPEGAGGLVVFGGLHYHPRHGRPGAVPRRLRVRRGPGAPPAGPGPPQGRGGRGAPTPGDGALLFLGGAVPGEGAVVEATPSGLYRLDYDERSLTPTKLDVIGDAPGSYTGSLIYDSKRRRWLSVCGANLASGANCSVHAYTADGGFTPVATSKPEPKGRWGFHYAYDEVADRVIVFGGQTLKDGELEIDGETWALDLASEPAVWSRLFANGAGPMKRRNGAYALDPVGHRLFVWGGTPDGKSSIENIQVLSLDRDAEAWTELEVPSNVPARTSAFGSYDAARERILFGFGNDKAIYRDLWALDVANINPR